MEISFFGINKISKEQKSSSKVLKIPHTHTHFECSTSAVEKRVMELVSAANSGSSLTLVWSVSVQWSKSRLDNVVLLKSYFAS